LVGPQRGSTILIVGLDTAVGAAQIDTAEADRRAAMAGGRTLPADATGLRVDRHQTALVGSGVEGIVIQQQLTIDVHHALEFRAALGLRDPLLPYRQAVARIQRHYPTAGQTGVDPVQSDYRSAVTAHCQHRQAGLVDPALLPGTDIQGHQLVILALHTTISPLVCGGASTSLETWVRHSSLPSFSSRVIMAPLRVPTMTRPPPAPTAPDRGSLSLTCQLTLPVSRSMDTTRPLASAA